MAKKGATIEITKEGLTGKKIAVQRATTHDSFLTDNFGDVVEVVRYGTQDEANLDLVAGRVDLLFGDTVALGDGLLKTDQGKDFEFVGPPYSDRNGSGKGWDRDPQVRHRPEGQVQRGHRRHPCQRGLGQDRGQVLRFDVYGS